MTQGESTVLPRPRRDAPLLEEEPRPEALPEREHFASILPGQGRSLFKAPRGRIGMR